METEILRVGQKCPRPKFASFQIVQFWPEVSIQLEDGSGPFSDQFSGHFFVLLRFPRMLVEEHHRFAYSGLLQDALNLLSSNRMPFLSFTASSLLKDWRIFKMVVLISSAGRDLSGKGASHSDTAESIPLSIIVSAKSAWKPYFLKKKDIAILTRISIAFTSLSIFLFLKAGRLSMFEVRSSWTWELKFCGISLRARKQVKNIRNSGSTWLILLSFSFKFSEDVKNLKLKMVNMEVIWNMLV